MSLRGQLAAAVHAAQAAKAASPDDPHAAENGDETPKGIARLFAEVGEAYTDFIASGMRSSLVMPDSWQSSGQISAMTRPG